MDIWDDSVIAMDIMRSNAIAMEQLLTCIDSWNIAGWMHCIIAAVIVLYY